LHDKPKISLLLDSGAFTAWTKGKAVDVTVYGKFVAKNQRHLVAAINLDVIIPSDPEKAAELGFENYLKLDEMGAVTMPVFHVGESLKWLDMMMETSGYVGLSATSMRGNGAEVWYTAMHYYASDAEGMPLCRFHGFGDTAPITLTSYPWHSVDSSSWLTGSLCSGSIYLNDKVVPFQPDKEDSKAISSQATGLTRELLAESFAAVGLNPEECLRADLSVPEKRFVRAFTAGVHHMSVPKGLSRKKTFEIDGGLGFLEKGSFPSHLTPVSLSDDINLHLVFGPDPTSFVALAAIGATHALISKAYMSDKQWEEQILPFIYDPLAEIKKPRYATYYAAMNKMMLNPVC
jgi:hypothetical protein